MRKSKLWKKLLGVEYLVFEDGDIVTDRAGQEILVFRVRPDHGHRNRCSRCGRRCRYHDSGEGRRRWRALDLGAMRCFLEAGAPRVACPAHGVVVAAVPWARPGSRFTRSFEDQAAWLCAAMNTTRAAELLRTTWRSLQAIITRVVADLAGKTDRLAGLRRIGIDEISYRNTGAAELADTRWAVLKKPGDLTTGQRTTIAALAAINSPLYKAYLMKEQLREIYRSGPDRGKVLLAGLISWCARCRIPEFVAPGRTLRRFRDLIWNTLETGTTNAKTEATNTHLRALTKRAYGFHSPGALIAMASLTRGGLCPPLPGR